MLERLRSQAQARGLAPDCIFAPATANVAECLRSIDIFVLPSRSEALSNSLLEAMACGCCPVASSVGGNSELIRHGENGMLFEAGDVDQLCHVLEPLIEHRELRQTLAVQGPLRRRAFLYRHFGAADGSRLYGFDPDGISPVKRYPLRSDLGPRIFVALGSGVSCQARSQSRFF